MKSKIFTDRIYETERYGNEEEFVASQSDRMIKMIDLIKKNKKKTKYILDVGCGVGFFTNYLNTNYKNAHVYGVDISKAALSKGIKMYKGIKFIRADAEVKLPFKDNLFDLVISGNHIEHLVDVDSYLKEINRVTKKSGVIILTTPNLGSWFNRVLLLLGKQPYFLDASLTRTLPIFKIWNYTFPENLDYPSSGHLRLYTLDMLKKLLLEYGLRTTDSRGAMMLGKPVLKQIDRLFTHIPSLAFRLIIKAEKVQNI